MTTKTIQTPKGEMTLLAPPVELLQEIRSFFPFGATRYVPPKNGADFGIVMQCGERELIAVKQQPVDCSEQQGLTLFQAHSILIAHSFAKYVTHGFSGLFMPCTYLRDKGAGKFESGIAYFGYPSIDGCEAHEDPDNSSYDGQFGRGFTPMMFSFIRALQESSQATKISMAPPIGLDDRPRSQLGSLGFGFMVVGPHVICLKTNVTEQDPTWMFLRESGISEVFHLPSVPAAIADSDLHITKPDV